MLLRSIYQGGNIYDYRTNKYKVKYYPAVFIHGVAVLSFGSCFAVFDKGIDNNSCNHHKKQPANRCQHNAPGLVLVNTLKNAVYADGDKPYRGDEGNEQLFVDAFLHVANVESFFLFKKRT